MKKEQPVLIFDTAPYNPVCLWSEKCGTNQLDMIDKTE